MKIKIATIIMALLLGIPQSSKGAPPANDDIQNAESVGDVTNLSFDTTEATTDGTEACMSGANIWYCYTASCTGTATVSLCGSTFDTKLAVYYYGCGSTPTSGGLLQCSDDFCGRQSQVAFPVTAGHSYLIEVGGYNILEFGSASNLLSMRITISSRLGTTGSSARTSEDINPRSHLMRSPVRTT